MLKKLAALLQRKPFPVPQEELIEISSLTDKVKKPTLKKATTRKPAVKKVATKVTKKTIKKKNVG